MVESMFTTVLNLVENFTFKRFLAVCCVFALIFSTVFFYEKYTNNFKLSRLQKSVEILRVLQEVKTNNIENNDSLLPIYKDIENELATLSDPSNPASLSFAPKFLGFKKFFSTFSVWLLFALISFIQQLKKREKEPNVIPGFLMIGLIFGLIGYLLPTIIWPWFNLVVFPVFHIIFLAIIGITIPQFQAYRKRAQEAKDGLTT